MKMVRRMAQISRDRYRSTFYFSQSWKICLLRQQPSTITTAIFAARRFRIKTGVANYSKKQKAKCTKTKYATQSDTHTHTCTSITMHVLVFINYDKGLGNQGSFTNNKQAT